MSVRAAVMAFVLGAALAGGNRPTTEHATVTAELGDDFAFDVAARFNASIIANIDAIDTALTAILAGVVAVIVFTIDKLHDVYAAETLTALALLAAAAVVCVAGYVIGFRWRGPGFCDFVSPALFIPDFAQQPGVAATNAIRHLMVASNVNLRLRWRKRLLAVCALALLLAGMAVVAAARLHAKVI